jgi:hypothetical protein
MFTHFRNSALPASVLDEDDEDDDEELVGESRDDERSGTKYNVRGLSTLFVTASLTYNSIPGSTSSSSSVRCMLRCC